MDGLVDPEPIGAILPRVWDALVDIAQPGFQQGYQCGYLAGIDRGRELADAEAEARHRRAAAIVHAAAKLPEVPAERQVPRTWAEREPVR